MNWKKIKAMVLSALGISALAENTLTAEQEETVKAAYGEDVLKKFKAGLAAENPEEHASAIHQAMRSFFAAEAEEATADLAEQLAAAQAENQRQAAMIRTLMDDSEVDPEAENPLPDGSNQPTVMRINANASHYVSANTYLQTGMAPMLAAGQQSIDIADLRTEFGTYLSQGASNLDIIRQIFNGFTSAEHFRTVPATTEYRAIQSMINSVVQQFKPQWTPKGNTKFAPLVIPNYRHKINVPIYPSDVATSYMFHLYDESLTPSQMPISKYIINQLIMPAILDDVEMRMIFKGKYVPSHDDQPTPAEDSMDGIETLLVREAANQDTRMNFHPYTIDLSSSTAREIVDFVNAFADSVDTKLKIRKIYASETFKIAYQRAYEEVYSGGTKVIGGMNQAAKVDYVQMEIVDLDGLGDSPIIFATTPGNMVKLRHINSVPNIVNNIVEGHYGFDIVGEFWLGAGFVIPEAVFASVPENYDPQQGLKPSTQFPDGTEPGQSGSDGSAGGSGSDTGGMP